MMKPGYTAPKVAEGEVTPAFVRDELLKCFESANGEFAELMHQPVTDEQLKAQVKSFVEGVFSQCGTDYVAPTKEGILTAISQCRGKAEQMMGAGGAEIIVRHYSEMRKLGDRLPG